MAPTATATRNPPVQGKAATEGKKRNRRKHKKKAVKQNENEKKAETQGKRKGMKVQPPRTRPPCVPPFGSGTAQTAKNDNTAPPRTNRKTRDVIEPVIPLKLPWLEQDKDKKSVPKLQNTRNTNNTADKVKCLPGGKFQVPTKITRLEQYKDKHVYPTPKPQKTQNINNTSHPVKFIPGGGFYAPTKNPRFVNNLYADWDFDFPVSNFYDQQSENEWRKNVASKRVTSQDIAQIEERVWKGCVKIDGICYPPHYPMCGNINR